MPIDETEDFIHVRIRDPAGFTAFRLTDFDGKLPAGVRAKYGRRPDGSWATQAYIFEKSKGWTRDKAVSWAKEHRGKAMPMRGVAYRWRASLLQALEFKGRHFAEYRIIDTSTSAPTEPYGGRWRVTYDALKKALKKLANHFLVGPPKQGHESTKIVGVPVEWNMPNGAIDVTYEILDEQRWKRIKAGLETDVSPQVWANDEDVEIGPDGVATLKDFSLEHVAQVDSGAFKNAILQNAWDAEMLHKLSAELFHSHESKALTHGAATRVSPLRGSRQAADQIKYRRGDSMSTNQNEKKKITASDQATKDKDLEEDENMDDQHQELDLNNIPTVDLTDVDVLKNEVSRLQAELAKANRRAEVAERQEPLRTLRAQHERQGKELKELREWKASIEKEAHMGEVTEVVDLRTQAGFADEADRADELMRVEKFNAAALKQMKADLEAFLLQSQMSGPKAQFVASANREADLETLVRQDMGLRKIVVKGEAKEGE